MGLENWGFGKKVNSCVRALLMSLSQVFDLSSVDGSGALALPSWARFLDEFRIVITHDGGCNGLFVFNTLIPQDHPGNFRWFGFPLKYFGQGNRTHLDHERSLGIVNRDESFIVDPTQDIFIVDFRNPDRRVFLILQTRLVIEYVCLEPVDVRISWDEWGRDAVVMEVPFSLDHVVVHGARVLTIDRGEGDHQTHVFDFSRRRIAALSLSDEVGDGTWRRAVFEDGFVFEGDGSLDLWQPYSVGVSVAFYFVSLLYCSVGESIETDLPTSAHALTTQDVSCVFLI